MAITNVELQHEKVYVAVGNNVGEGIATLEWAIKRWSSHPISIIILHPNSPFEKLPVTLLRKCEEDKTDRILAKYLAVCGKKVSAEIRKIERQDQPIQEVMLELIMELHITHLVMAITFKSEISGSFHLHRKKPDFCEVYMICRGKLVLSREKEEEVGDEDKQKPSLKGWIGKVLASGKTVPYPTLSESKEIEDYFQQLLAEDDDDHNPVAENASLCPRNPIQPHTSCLAKMNEEKLEVLKMQIMEAKRMIQLKKDEVNWEIERQEKASWAITLCKNKAEELETRINEETTARNDLNDELEDAKEQIYEVAIDIQDTENRLSSLLEIQSDLSNKLQASSLAKSRTEAQLESAASARTELVREIEELRKKRDVLHRRIEFCKEKDAIAISMSVSMSCKEDEESGIREFSREEIKSATDDFSENRRLKSRGEWTDVYKGRLNKKTVAIKILDLDLESFQEKVSLLTSIRHANIVSIFGFCTEPRCLVLEYMPNGCLRDILFSRRKSTTLDWRHRIHIAAEVASALGFLHHAKPEPVIYGSLNPSNILLDGYLVSKLENCRFIGGASKIVDVPGLGILLLQLLCGRNWAGMDHEKPEFSALDGSAGEWPLDLVEEIMEIGVRCMGVEEEEDVERVMSSAVKTLSLVRKKADGMIDKFERRKCEKGGNLLDRDTAESSVPVIFLCPIFKGIMENPYVAADGYSYEFEAIEEWLQTGHEMSPITKIKLEHKHITANHTLRSLIQEWRTLNPDLCNAADI